MEVRKICGARGCTALISFLETRCSLHLRKPFERRRVQRNGSTRSWRLKREIVFKRDGYRCTECGFQSDSSYAGLQLGHVIPFSETQDDSIPNLRTECRPCNQKSGSQLGATRTNSRRVGRKV